MVFSPVPPPALCPYFMRVSSRTRTRTTTQKRAILMAIYEIKLLIPEILVYHTFL